MAKYPLLFTYRDLVSGNGFLAGITTSGRGLLVEERDGSWTMYGVHPGAIAGVGESREAATAEFREMYRAALYDIAETTGSFHEFEAEVRSFFWDKNETNETEWNEAAERIAGGHGDGWLKTQKAKKHPPKVHVEEVSDRGAEVNQLDEEPVAAVA